MILLLAAMGTALLLSSGVALALNTITCESNEACRGTEKADLMKGADGFNYMLGRAEDDTLKGFGRGDGLLGQQGDDTLLGGLGHDSLLGGRGDDRLRGEDASDFYIFERTEWGKDTIIEDSPSRNGLILPFIVDSTSTITTNLDSDAGPVPEVSNSASASTINWGEDVISFVDGSTGNDTVTGNEVANWIFDDVNLYTETGPDTDIITGAEGKDFIVVKDGDGDDSVSCGAGNDTVYFDAGDELIVEADCEEQNPQEPELERQQADGYGAEALEGPPPSAVEGYRP